MRTGKKATPIIGKYSGEHRGNKSTLNEELSMQIVDMAERGKINSEIITELGIPEETFYSWHARNTNNLKDKIGDARRKYLLDIAEQGLTKLANSKSERIQLQTLIYLSERLDKKHYATKTEFSIDESEGKELEPENKEKLEKLLLNKDIISPLQLK